VAVTSSPLIIYLMNRKHFLSGILTLPALLPALQGAPKTPEHRESFPGIPPYLKLGDIIGITSPAGYITHKEIAPAVQQIESWGFKTRIGSSIGKRDFTFGGTDKERADDLQQLLDDHSVKAIMCARGGYGAVRIIDMLDFRRFQASPKWIIGFSDITVLHSHLSRNYGIASIHSKMCNSFPDEWTKAEPIQVETILSIKHALSGMFMSYNAPPNFYNITGSAEGSLIGGNLKTLESLAGSKSDIRTKGRILFVEDTGEYLYSIDRMFWNLKRNGKLDDLKGLVVGGFKVKTDILGEEFGKTVYDIVLEKVKDYDYPVCFDFPVGHQKNNYALKCGVKHKLEVHDAGATLTEIV
jgi:muramoyltetrapeptide carboxypeptidase